MKRLFLALTGALFGLLIAWWVAVPRSGTVPSAPVTAVSGGLQPYPAAPLSLTDHRREPFVLSERDRPVAVVFFGYTSCPDVCPITMNTLARAVQSMGATGDSVRGIMVTVDPEVDTPARLGQWLEAIHPDFLGLTGSTEELQATYEAWGVLAVHNHPTEEGAEAAGDIGGSHDSHGSDSASATSPEAGEHQVADSTAPTPGPRWVDHSARAFVIGPDDRVVASWLPDVAADSVRTLLRRALDRR